MFQYQGLKERYEDVKSVKGLTDSLKRSKFIKIYDAPYRLSLREDASVDADSTHWIQIIVSRTH